ncbi:MAG: adenylate/guanylate cyclase domain-containing protein, partial [Deltaproteobacteria bacterium]|nr:adenylate/guanylate cyclase domain-containing protein [Deltaproteobacteria bacterium]
MNTEPLPVYARRSPRDYTPPFLVEQVLKLGSAIRGERKEVSVMFVDVAGFTRIGERFDSEDIHEMMNGCFEILGQEIHLAGGTINQYTGDGVMALFGAPIAYEDHYGRACHAALGIQRRMKDYSFKVKKRYGIKFRIRTGLHMGPVVVGAIGDNLRLDYTAVGDTTNLAARLESLAPPGRIWVSRKFRDAAQPFFRFRKTGVFRVKGKKERIAAFSLLGEREIPYLQETRRSKPIPFVDREKELAAMQEAHRMMLQGKPQVITLEGEAGIGKSRFLEQFR